MGYPLSGNWIILGSLTSHALGKITRDAAVLKKVSSTAKVLICRMDE